MFSKLGPHVIVDTPPARAWSSQARVVKQLDGTSALAAAPPGASTVFRKYFANQDIDRHGGDIAREIIAALGGFRPSYVELYNETAQRLGQGLERHVEFTAEAVEVLHQESIAVAGFCFSVGNPEQADWQYLKDHNFGDVDAIGVHEYWGNKGLTLDCALRHRRVHEWLGGVHPPIIITECGRDYIPEEGTSVAGWIAQGIAAEQYLQELTAYDYALLQDHYVVGATVFTAGAAGGNWRYFDVDTLVAAILGAGPIEEPVRLSGWLVFGMLAFAAGSLAILLNKLQPYDILELQAGETAPPGYVEAG